MAEIDAEVAEVVMGQPIPNGFLRNLKYSSDISAAWLVVEKMLERGYWLTLEQNLSDCWQATFSDEYSADHEATAPLAICRAALSALGRG